MTDKEIVEKDDQEIMDASNCLLDSTEDIGVLTLDKIRRAFRLGRYREYPTIRPQRL